MLGTVGMKRRNVTVIEFKNLLAMLLGTCVVVFYKVKGNDYSKEIRRMKRIIKCKIIFCKFTCFKFYY